MWILNGPFDGEVVGDLNFTKSKLVKTGKTYGIGRKGCPLIVNNKKISSSLGEFIVGDFSADEAMNPESHPSLQFVHKKEKALKLFRNDEQLDMEPDSPQELQDGDRVGLITGVYVHVEWKELCCYGAPIRGKSLVSLEACVELGIHLVQNPHLQVTHHLCSTISSNPAFASSLLTLCQFARPEWVNEIIRLGKMTLESNFALPSTSKYLPDFSDSLLEHQRSEKVWQPNEERHVMLSHYRFLCVDEKGRELGGNFREMIERGGASFEVFDPHSGRTKFHKALARGQAKERKTQIVVGKQASIKAAVGQDGWKDLLEEARLYRLGFTSPDRVIQAIIDVDLSLLVGDSASDLPQESETLSLSKAGPTSADEPSSNVEESQDSQPRRKLVRRATSRQPSVELTSAQESTSSSLPSADLEEPEIRPKRTLTRRVNAGLPAVTGLDDPSSIIDAVPDLGPPRQNTPPPAIPIDLAAPTPARPRKLKRRAVGGVPNVVASQALSGIDETPVASEPPLKKFKALFDASGQETFDQSAFDEVQSGNYSGTSQTQTQTQGLLGANGPSRRARNLSVLREEEEESQMPSVDSVGNKRPLEDIDENIEPGDDAPTGAQPSKRRAVENINAVDRVDRNTEVHGKPPSTAKSNGVSSKPTSTATTKGTKTGGAEPGKPDQDHAFLKALASTKKGKKREDEFDRDFNKLRISKPTLERPNPEDEWKILAEFGDDSNVRGNFMTIVELPAYNRSALDSRRASPNPAWNGLPNFKKFQRKNVPRSEPIALYASEASDYGIGPTYWKDGTPSDSRSQLTSTESIPHIPSQSIKPTPRSQAPVLVDSSDSEVPIQPKSGKSTRASSRAGSVVQSKPKATRSARSRTAQPLFIEESDEDEDQVEEDELMDVDDDTSTLATNTVSKARSRQSSGRAGTRGKRPVILADDDSDDGVFKGFGTKSKRR